MMSEVKDYGNGYNSNNSVVIVWAIEDVREQLEILNENMFEKVDLELTDNQCMQVLYEVAKSHDSNYGVNWEDFYIAIQYCFEDEINELKEKK
jgi:uncharacterized protein YfkK (UPF0435 family)